jgi:Putative phage abortive infection protein
MESDGSERKNTSPIPRWVVWVSFLGVLLLWAGAWLFFARGLEGSEFGGSFGAVDALFSGLAFAGVIFAILLQRGELRLQRQELEETRDVMERQQAALASQDATLKRQTFENTFFQLLRLHHDNVSSMDLFFRGRGSSHRGTPAEKYYGRDCFQKFYERLQLSFKDASERLGGAQKVQPGESIFSAYEEFFQEHQADVGHYFRSLYHIIKFVNGSDVENKGMYTSLVRAQLSSFELLLLFYNGLSAYGCQRFKPLIECYALLKTVPITGALIEDSHYHLYEPGAFGRIPAVPA